ncbi:MAG: thioesterase family protein [Frankiales bacterium]|nr:thioesterase family protein [Frankiales bacterium]
MTALESDLDPSWAVGGKPHGGYLLRTAVTAALDVEHPHPLAVSAHYVSSPVPGRVQIDVEPVRRGRRVSMSRIRLSQEGLPRVEVLLSAGRLHPDSEPHWSRPGGPPHLPPLQHCPRMPSVGPTGHIVAYFDHVEARLDPATTRWTAGDPQGAAEVRGWMRRADRADADVLDLLVFCDAMPPVTFDLGLMGWVPTLELTVHLRSLPAPGWLRVVQRARLLQDGWLDEECEVWDSRDRLVAQARQLAGYRLQ